MGKFYVTILCLEGTILNKTIEIPKDILTKMSFDDIDYFIEEDINSAFSDILEISWERIEE